MAEAVLMYMAAGTRPAVAPSHAPSRLACRLGAKPGAASGSSGLRLRARVRYGVQTTPAAPGASGFHSAR